MEGDKVEYSNGNKVQRLSMSEDKGYLILDDQQVYYYDDRLQIKKYLLTLPLHKVDKIIPNEDNLYFLSRSKQRIYCVALKNKMQKWYYFNKNASRELVDFDIINSVCHLYYKDKENMEMVHKLIDIKGIPSKSEQKHRDNPYIIGQNTHLA